ncbi:MAG: 2,3-bisphosphoglycerate-independent phosphoglycerate mutase [Candidatus Promineifilaceae bacterium]
MADLNLMRQLARPDGGKIILLVLDGLGGLPLGQGSPSGEYTALELARTPNMDQLARAGCLGLSYPLGRGITPGSGPAHLALFGYDPIARPIGRGVLEALGIGLELRPGDLAARGNLCTVDEDGAIIDRRAGRVSTEMAAPAVARLAAIRVPGLETIVRAVKEYRIAVIFRGSGLRDELGETDPQVTGEPPLPVEPLIPEAAATAVLVQQWIDAAKMALYDLYPINMITLRGFGQDPSLPSFTDSYKLRAACVAVYPMYQGVSRLVGMDVLATAADFTPADEFERVAEHWDAYDFFFVHIKPTDSRGEDGKLEAKAAVIESVDAALPILLKLKPEVLVITGDHSTPAKLMFHSWHPVPTLLWAPASHLPDAAQAFGEREAQCGGLGHFPAADLMPLALAHALRLDKYGA